MAASKKTPHRVRKVLAMHKAGSSAREIADEMGLALNTVIGWMRDAGLEPNGGHGPRSTRDRVPAPEPAGAMAEAVSTITAITNGHAPGDRQGAVGHLQARLMQISAAADLLVKSIPTGMSNPAQLSQIIRLERELAAGIVELSPREQQSPESDPTNLEAAAAVRRKFTGLVEAVERRVVCRHCGKHPFRDGGKA